MRCFFDTAIINGSTSLTEGSSTFFTQKQGVFDTPVLFSDSAYGHKGLQVSMPSSSNNNVSDRIEYIWVNENDSDAPAFDGQARYLGFTFQLMAGSVAPVVQNPLISQFWQGGSSTLKYSPPVYLEFILGTLNAQLCVKNDGTGKFLANPPIIIWQGAINIGEWHRYIIRVLPNYTADYGASKSSPVGALVNGNGEVRLWVDGVSVARFNGQVGYTPQSQGGDPVVLDTMRVKTGLYRHD